MKGRRNLLRSALLVAVVACAAVAAPQLLGQADADPPPAPDTDLPYADEAMEILDDALGPDSAEPASTPFDLCLDAAGTVCA